MIILIIFQVVLIFKSTMNSASASHAGVPFINFKEFKAEFKCQLPISGRKNSTHFLKQSWILRCRPLITFLARRYAYFVALERGQAIRFVDVQSLDWRETHNLGARATSERRKVASCGSELEAGRRHYLHSRARLKCARATQRQRRQQPLYTHSTRPTNTTLK